MICVLAAAAATPTIARWELPALAHRDPTVSHDLDGDGKDDGWTTNYSYLGVGIYVGGELLQLRQTFPSRTFGDDITWAGDVDGDGHPDLVLDAPGSQDGTISGSLWVIRGGPDMTVDGVWVAPGHVEFADRGSLESFTMALPGKWAGWRWPAGTLVDDGYVTIRGRVRTCGVTLEGTRDHPIRVRHGPVNGSIAFEIHAPAEIAGHRYRPDVVFLRCVDGQPVVDLGRLDEPATVFGAPLQPGDKFHFHGAEGRESKLDVTFGAPRDVGGVLASEATWLDGRLLSARVLPGEYTVGNWEIAGGATFHPDGSLRSFTLAKDTEADGFLLAARTYVELDASGRVVAGTLVWAARYEGHPIGAAGFRADPVTRELWSYTTVEPEVIGGIPVPPGSQVGGGPGGGHSVKLPADQMIRGLPCRSFVVFPDGQVVGEPSRDAPRWTPPAE